MIVTVATNGKEVAEHFGHCPSFTIFEIQHKKIVGVREVSNPYFTNHKPGDVPKLVASFKTDVLIAGSAGPMAINLLKQENIRIFLGVTGKVRKAVEDYLENKLVFNKNLCPH